MAGFPGVHWRPRQGCGWIHLVESGLPYTLLLPSGFMQTVDSRGVPSVASIVKVT